MQSYSSNTFARPDTLFGVCQAIGDDFGFNPLVLRVAFALPLFWNPMAAIGAYLALGLLVALTRWMVPNPVPAASPQANEAAEAAPVAAEQEAEPELALAA